MELTIQAARTHARKAHRDGRIRSNDFLDMESDPTITFAFTDVKQVDRNHYRARW